jgi:hypothetical protein
VSRCNWLRRQSHSWKVNCEILFYIGPLQLNSRFKQGDSNLDSVRLCRKKIVQAVGRPVVDRIEGYLTRGPGDLGLQGKVRACTEMLEQKKVQYEFDDVPATGTLDADIPNMLVVTQMVPRRSNALCRSKLRYTISVYYDAVHVSSTGNGEELASGCQDFGEMHWLFGILKSRLVGRQVYMALP